MAVREALWDCQYCGKQGNLGRHKDCYHCGKSRPAGTKFYLPADAAAIEDPRLTALAELGPDWVCAFCGTSNGADVTNCTSCQAARDADAQQQKVQQYAPGAAPQGGDMSFDEPAPPPEQPRQAAASRPTGRRAALIGGGVALLLACLCVATAFLLLRTASVSAEVTGMS